MSPALLPMASYVYRRAIPVLVMLGLGAVVVSAQNTEQPKTAAPSTTTAFVTNVTRVEAWSYFQPKPDGGNPRYAFVANRLQFGARHTATAFELLAAGQYVQFGGLPTDAVGPGPYGTGALYFGHSGDTSSNQLYLRYLSLRLKSLIPGLQVEIGRMGYAGGMESPSGDARIEALKNARVAARLLGEFEWSIYQRGYDGIRLDYPRPSWHVTGVAYHPTQGGFEDAAGVQIDDVTVFVGALTLKPGLALPRTETQFFYYRYDDRREVHARVDNSGLPPADRVDIEVDTFGVTLAGAFPRGSGVVDTLVWVVGQTGSWYDQTHRAFAVAVEGGYQWTGVRWHPWFRLGGSLGSGDEDPGDDRHQTFFQLLPTVRKYSLSTSYNLMNATELFIQVMVRPRPPLSLRLDLHTIALTEAADRWYFGSGATQNRGTIFGYGSRPSNGSTTLGTIVEGAASYDVTPRWSVNGYLGFLNGGQVVLGSFNDKWLTFGYLESAVRF